MVSGQRNRILQRLIYRRKQQMDRITVVLEGQFKG